MRGRVQGVGFRASAAHEARRLGIVGWVRNLPDGSVELEARGAPAAVDALCGWLAQGPRGARVKGVGGSRGAGGGVRSRISWAGMTRDGFEIR